MNKRLITILLSVSLAGCAGSGTRSLPVPSEDPEETPSVQPSNHTESAIRGSLQDYREDYNALAEFAEKPAVSAGRTAAAESSEVIIGEDNRVPVYDVSAYPYSAIGYMLVHASCGCEWTGSGYMAGPSGFVTAAHCLCCADHQAYADTLTIYFGFQSWDRYLCCFNGTSTFWVGTTFPGGYTDENAEWDYAYVKLSERVGDVTGWLGTVYMTDEELDGAEVELAGYRDGVLMYDRGRVFVDGEHLFVYEMDMLPGNSGCPLFFYYGDYEDHAAAVNIAENSMYLKNYGRRITGDVFQAMEEAGIFR
ncbi:MAG: hypothetical protein J6S26_06185 [Solobacterium sp.]|nr:hypothetical protein [Solobacterium sp.]